MDHVIPAILRAIDVLESLSRKGSESIAALTAELSIPRSTVYRVLNSLEQGGLVRRNPDGTYSLGSGLARIASRVSMTTDIVFLARPFLETLSSRLGATAKLSVLDGDRALVVSVVESRQNYSVSTQVGRSFPLHAGAASKMLLAWLDPEDLARILSLDLEVFTENTIVSKDRILEEIETIRSRGVSHDRSEFVDGIHAIAAPVCDARGECVAAISIPYLAAAAPEKVAAIEAAIVDTAHEFSASLGASR